MTTTETPTVAGVLRQAAELIEQRGLACGVWETASGQLCAAGAIRRAVGGPADGRTMVPQPAGRALEHLAHFVTGKPPRSQLDALRTVLRWSDQRDRAAVAAGLRRSADALERRGRRRWRGGVTRAGGV